MILVGHQAEILTTAQSVPPDRFASLPLLSFIQMQQELFQIFCQQNQQTNG